ncbi:ESX secretion-associated protein EspG [Nocardia sp. SSK8]|uniref:ESX secretion-associated protein EspG n=1 Tax=Nocardia sp. SSK8 TaxID=3120154 RepID=UPI00300BF001
MRTVRFTAQEFEILWTSHDRDRLPYPLQFRTAISDFDQLARDRASCVESLLEKYDPVVESALGVLLTPEARLESKGFRGLGSAEVIRFYGAVRGSSGATLYQLPGSASDTGGDVILRFGTLDDVAEQAVAALPRSGPGSRPPVEVTRERLAEEDNHFEFRAGVHSAAERLSRVVRRKRLAFGEVSAFPGPSVDSRPGTRGRTFWWMDFADGRYFAKTGDPIIVEPIDAARLTAGIRAMLGRVQRYHLEDLDEGRCGVDLGTSAKAGQSLTT